MQNSKRVYEIDLLRLIAALSVVFFHYTFRGYATGDFSTVFFPYINQASRYGILGVHLFFMISGFVILLSAENKGVIDFSISRFVRLYPTFWLILSIISIFLILFGGSQYHITPKSFLLNLTMLNELFGVDYISGVVWSLLLELRFYFLVAILIFFKQLDNIVYYLTAWLIISFSYLFVNLHPIIKFAFFPEYSSFFIAGALFYLIHRDGISLYKILLLMLSYYLSIKTTLINFHSLAKYFSTEFNSQVFIVIITLFYTIFFLISIKKTEKFKHKLFLKLGALTYPLYLIHENIGYIILNTFNHYINKYLLLIMLVSLMIFIAYMINIYFENRYLSKIKRGLESFFRKTIHYEAKHIN